MKPVVVYFLLLSNCGLVVWGFSLRGCFLSQDKAFCDHNKLTEVPTDIPLTVKIINLSSNNISKIKVSDFLHFPSLNTLHLTENCISTISKRSFSQLASLQWLVLSRNKLVKLEDNMFHGLSKLTRLDMASNLIDTVDPNAFNSMSHLLVLDLSKNKLQTIAQVHLVIQHMPNLKFLLIGNNDITTFRSQDLANASTVIKQLDMSENPLEKFEVTTDVFPKLSKLKVGNPTVKLNLTWAVKKSSLLHQLSILDISAVQLSSTDEWKQLFSSVNSVYSLVINSKQNTPALINISCSILKLSQMQIQTNALNSINTTLFQMCHGHKLTVIELRGNNITHIENGSFEFLHYLRTLSLRDNRLSRVPSATRNLHQLQTLDLSFNRIKTLGCQDFAGLTSLKQLSLQWNNITVLNKCTFAGLSKLDNLNIQGNSISELGSAFQTSLPNLKVLKLNQNKLSTIRTNEFSGLHSLTNISLFQNQIKTLEKGSFSGLKKLMDLKLSMNELRKDALDRACFNDLVNLRSLDFENNHIKYLDCSPLKEPPFVNLSSLEMLRISEQHGPGRSCFPSNFLQGLSKLLAFISNNVQLLNFADEFFTSTPNLDSLDIGANDLLDMSPNVFAPIPNLRQLRISSTNLPSLDFLINANLTKLKVLKARKTPFSVISEDIIRSVPSLQELDLIQNTFTCDCDNEWFVRWITGNNYTQVLGAYSFMCNYPPESSNTRLLDFNVQSCLVDIGFLCFISTTCVDVVILLASFIFHFSRFHVIYAYYILLAWLYDSRNRQKRAACRYDAFVSYNSHDEAWVFRELVPQLEQEQGWRLCLHHRDFLPGKPIVENIADSIYGSRKTICVISRRYLQSEWCSKEMQLASFRLFDEREDVLILVFLEDIPSSHLSPYYRMKRLLKKRSYLSWPRAAQHPQLFWEKLRQALRSTSTEEEDEEDRLRLTVTT